MPINIESLQILRLPTVGVDDEGFREEKPVIKEIPITPHTDSWLIAKERTWEEVDEALEGRLQGLQNCFCLTDGQPNSLEQKYGLERPASGNMSRFLAYVGLADEYRRVDESFEGKAKMERVIYEQDKDKVRKREKAKLIKPKNARSQLEQLQRSAFPSIDLHSKRAVEAESVRNLIMRKAVMDFFSVENNTSPSGTPLIVQAFPKLLDEAKKRFNSATQEPEEFHARLPLDYFIDTLGDYLSTTTNPDLIHRFAYRKSPGIITKKEDCEVLDAGPHICA